MKVLAEKDKRLEQLVELLVKYTSLDFSEKAETSDRGDVIDAFAVGLNNMAEELEFSLENGKKQVEQIKQLNRLLEQKVNDKTVDLEKSEKLFRTLIEKNEDMMTLGSPEGKLLYSSPSLNGILGFTKEEFAGRPAFEFIHPDDLPALMEQMSEIINAPGKSFHRQQRLLHKDGTYRWCEGTVTNMLHDEAIGALVSNFRDITERKEIEKKLKVAFKRSVHAEKIAHLGHWEVDIRTWQAAWSDEAFRIYGLEPGTAKGSYELFLSLIHPDDIDRVKSITGKSMHTFESFSLYHRIVRKGGEIRHILASGEYEFDKTGKAVRLLGVAMDVTELKEKELKLMQSETHIRNFARHLNTVLEDERSHIAREMHDELGQRLAGLKIGISLIKKYATKENELEDKATAMMDDIDSTIQSMRKISTELRPGILDSLGLLASLKWLAQEFERKTKIKCTTGFHLDEHVFEKNLSTCYFRICQEALTNISKHAGANEVLINVTFENNFLQMKISDDGKGMENKKLENPFSMGLLGMRERANIIGGTLQIDSEKNRGTTIVLTTII